MTESGIAPNECELPCDCELPAPPGGHSAGLACLAEAPAVANVGHPCSYYLTLPRRTLAQAVRDVSRRRDLPEWVWELLRPSNVVRMADYRRVG